MRQALAAGNEMEGRLGPVWAAAVPMVALAALLVSPPERQMLSVLVAAFACIAVQMFLPQARFRTGHYFSPVNVALALLHLKIIGIPVLLMLFGYENKIMALTATTRSWEGAILVDTAAYVAFCGGLQLYGMRRYAPGRFSPVEALSATPGRGYVVCFAILGLAGFVLTFGSPGRLMEYFADPAAVLDNEGSASFGEFLGTMLRPFLAFSLVTWWARVADESLESGRRWGLIGAGVVAAAGITLANLTFGFNRGAVVFPLLALAGVYSLRIRRIPPVLTMAVLAGAVPLLLAVGAFRSNSHLSQGAPAAASKEVEVPLGELSENIVVYGGGPQMTAVFYESIDWGEKLYGGVTLVSSIMNPVPVLGKGFRETGGPIVYNRAIYGTSGIDDQILPFASELFANFHLAGVVAGFVGFGLLLSLFESWLGAVRSTFGAFVIQFIAVWGAMLSVWSLSVYVQILFYFLGPVYLYLAATQVRGWLGRVPYEEVQIGDGMQRGAELGR